MKKILALLIAFILPTLAIAASGPNAYSNTTGLTATTVAAQTVPVMMVGYNIANANSSITYVQFFDASATTGIVLGTTAPIFSIAIPANGVVDGQQAFAFKHGVVMAATTTASGLTAPSTAVPITLFTN